MVIKQNIKGEEEEKIITIHVPVKILNVFINSFNFHNNPIRYHYPHFTDVQPKAQKG